MEERIALLESEVAKLRRQASRRQQRHRWWRVPTMLLCAALLAAVPMGVLGANFVDLHPGSTHNPNINAIADAGITRGCFDTSHYCPDDYVTREQMASFLARTAGLGGNPPVTNAAYLNGWPAHALVRTTGNGSGDTLFAVSSGVYGAITTATISVPAPGFVIATGAVDVFAVTASDAYVTARVRDVNGAAASFPVGIQVGTIAGDVIEGSITPTTIFLVNGTGSRTFALDVGRGNSSVGSTGARRGTLTLLYVPFGAGGAQAAVAETMGLAEVDSPVTPAGSPPDGQGRP